MEVVRGGGSTRVHVFDPKYKLGGDPFEADPATGKPKKAALDKMHAYRDAAGECVVRCAAVLYPGPELRYPDGIEALSGYPGHDELMRRRPTEVLTEALR